MSEKNFFGTDGIRGRAGVEPITPETMLKLGWAFGTSLKDHSHRKVVIGKDTRLSGYMVESALEAGLVAAGADVIQLGPMPTPGVSYLAKHLPVAAGIMISASHNPFHDNGIKFFNSDGFKLCDEKELAIEALMRKPIECVANERIGRAERLEKAPQMYKTFCRQSFVNFNLKGLKLVVDCAHGAMYHMAPELFAELGAEVHTIGCQPNGLNINDGVGSTYPEALQLALKQHPGAIGVAFDGDGDRLLFVDEQNQIVDGDEILFILARAKLENQTLQGGVVGTLMTNFGVERAFAELNIPFVRSQVGDRYVLDALNQRGWQLGGETSGHIIDLSKTTSGDGLMAALLVLEQVLHAQKTLFELKQGLVKYTQTLINVPVSSGKAIVASQSIQALLEQEEKKLNGLGRIVLRSSGTEPLVRVMVEAQEPQTTLIVARTLANAVESSALTHR